MLINILNCQWRNAIDILTDVSSCGCHLTPPTFLPSCVLITHSIEHAHSDGVIGEWPQSMSHSCSVYHSCAHLCCSLFISLSLTLSLLFCEVFVFLLSPICLFAQLLPFSALAIDLSFTAPFFCSCELLSLFRLLSRARLCKSPVTMSSRIDRRAAT